MKATKEQMRAEALRRLNELVRHQGLNPKIPRYFQEGKLYYSYLTCGGFMGSIDTITYDPRYAKAAKQFEQFYGGLVYHAIETGGTLAVLYVSEEMDQWPEEIDAKRGYLMANVYDLENDYDEIGTIRVTGFQGALARIG